MKIECVQEKLSTAVSKAEKITGKHVTLPILTNLLLEVTKEGLTIRATNLDVGVELSVQGKVLDTGSVVVPGNIFQSLVQNISDQKVVLEKVENTLLVSSENTSTTIKTIPGEDFPSIPRITMKESFSIHVDEFLSGVKSVWYAASLSSMKPELSSVYMTHNEDEVVFVATDSFRLAEKKIRVKKVQEFSDVLVPVKNVIDITKILEGYSGDIIVQIAEGQIGLEVDGVYVTSRLVEGNFPDYNQIIPKETTTTATVLKQDLVTSLRTAHIFSDKFNTITFHVEPSNNKLFFETKNSDIGENTTGIRATLEGQDVSLNFNNKYVIDSFQSISSDSLKLLFNGEGKPMIIRGVSDTTFLYLVMPMSV